MNLGINLCFAVKRLLEPQEWAAFVRAELGLTNVQITFDLLEPWWPEPERGRIIARIRQAATEHGLHLHSACVGLAHYLPGGLLDPDPDARALARTWWRRAIDVAAELGVSAVGGPLGSISVHDAAHGHAEQRWQDLIDAVAGLCRHARAAGLAQFLIEPTPINREVPSTLEHCHRLMDDLARAGAGNAAILLDIGHTVYEPLYGPQAAFQPWIGDLAPHLGLIHLDNTDRHGDPHWGWPHPAGTIDVSEVWESLRTAGLADLPVMLEVFPRFEDDDETVHRHLLDTVTHCRAAVSTGSRA
uniref:sugar phosphate isomerase/epimerase family protein n=1 Tax=Nonomuraea sp. CA-252377 TaxID=3240003 RepID=UPI003F491E3F